MRHSSQKLAGLAGYVVAILCLGAPLSALADDPAPDNAATFQQDIRPLLHDYCLKCHSTDEQKGDLDLERFTSLGEINKSPKVWQSVAEHLTDNEMPPKGKPQMSAEQKAQLTTWLGNTLDALALAHAGDPGPVVLRRLSNAEYTYTIRDLTGIASLDPVHEFPADGAAGEGFTNTGQSLVMSPSLVTKYLAAAKDVASHAVLLPDGLHFSAGTTRRDWTEEILAKIRGHYAEYSSAGGATSVNLQGIKFETNGGGRLPVEKYLAATLEEREALTSGTRSVDAVATERKLSPKYLGILWKALHDDEPSLLLSALRAEWRTAQPSDVGRLAAQIGDWQKVLWKFNSVGQIGKAGSAKTWQEPVSPVVARQEIRVKLPPSPDGKPVQLFLAVNPYSEASQHDIAVWERPRLVKPGQPDLLLHDLRQVSDELAARRARLFSSTAKCLDAATEASVSEKINLSQIARQYDVDEESLAAWFEYLGIGSPNSGIATYLTQKIPKAGTYDFIKGWGGGEALSFVANSSDQTVRIPGTMKPHGIAMHPMPKIRAAVGWRSPINGNVVIDAKIQRAHLDCGAGITWALQLRHGAVRQQLAAGEAKGGEVIPVKTAGEIRVQQGDLVSILIGPRNGDHTCGLTAVDLVITSQGENTREWNLAADVAPNPLAGNPHADHFGNPAVWHFYSEPDKGGDVAPTLPDGSLLTQWQSAVTITEKQRLAEQLQTFLTAPQRTDAAGSDASVRKQLIALIGRRLMASPIGTALAGNSKDNHNAAFGIDPAMFGKRPDGSAIDPANLSVRAPSTIEVSLPSELAEGCEFVTTATLDHETGMEGAVQMQALAARPDAGANSALSLTTPVIALDNSAARQKVEASFAAFRDLFPAALCYAKIVPVDEVITLILHYREDDQLMRLMLDEKQKAELDRLWDELHYVSHDALTMVDAFEQIWQFATQDGDPKVFIPMREPNKQHAAEFRQRLLDTEPRHLDAALRFAEGAYRRPLADVEKAELRGLYAKLRAQELPHEDAIRLVLARVLVAPAFLYHAEKPGPGTGQAPVNDWELANRLSYFLWSSAPDDELRAAAASGTLHTNRVLLAQTRRMLRDPHMRRMATEFGCAWLHIHDFDESNEKSEKEFPAFTALRGDMYEESIRFFTDFFQNDRSILDLLGADYTYLNEAMATHYGIPGVSGSEWRLVAGVRKYSRGGILTQATTLSKQSGASRTSPILRGSWIVETLLGEKLPKPPKDVPRLPEDEATQDLTVRQLTQRHTSDERCSGCHARFDAFGFVLENFDAIGRFRERDAGKRPLDTVATVKDGTQLHGLDGLRDYLMNQRRDVFLHQFCRKLLGYSLGRSVQLSDEPLLKEIQINLAKTDCHIGTAIEMIVQSHQFREIRGHDAPLEE